MLNIDGNNPLAVTIAGEFDHKLIFAKASEIAAERYPYGCRSAEALAQILREAIQVMTDNANA